MDMSDYNSLCKDRLYLIDSCALFGSDGVSGFDLLSSDLVPKCRHLIDFAFHLNSHLKSLIETGFDVKTIPEVIQERAKSYEVMKTRVKDFNMCRENIRRRDRRFGNKYKAKRGAMADECKVLSSLMDRYSKEIRRGNILLENITLGPSCLSDEQKEIYEAVLHDSSFQFEDETEKFGTRLQTDSKLIATAIAHSMRRPVLVISRDEKLLDVLKDVLLTYTGRNNELGLEDVEVYRPIIEKPILYNPDFVYDALRDNYPWKH